MAFRLQDFECSECEHVTEILLDSREKDENNELHPTCEKCGSGKIKPIISAGAGNGTHITWSKWRMNLDS